MNPALLQLLISESPVIIAFIKGLFAQKNPDQPIPTDEEVHAAYQAWITQTLAKDDAIIGDAPSFRKKQ